MRVAFIGNSLPRRCGIATFTTDLELAVSALDDVADTAIVAMCDTGGAYHYPPMVGLEIRQDSPGDYLAAADFINAGGYDVVCLQHEFGIFGGEAGAMILPLIAALKVPLVTTLHTVLDQPAPAQRRVMDAILAASARVIVMARKGQDILIETYGADPERIAVIPHGIPDVPFEPCDAAKLRLGFEGRRVILTFGLISPNKGIETMIEAMPAVIAGAPDAVYVVMGATHPHLLREAGEAYRESLVDRVHKLGIEDHVVFLNRFVDRPELLDHIAMARNAYRASRPSTWANTAKRYVACMRAVSRKEPLRVIGGRDVARPALPVPILLLPPSTRHFIAMCDDTGLFQHAVHSIPDQHHGYCVDTGRSAKAMSPMSSTRAEA